MAQVAADVLALEIERVAPNVPTLFERDVTFYADIEKRPVEVISSRDMRVPLELDAGGRTSAADFDGGDLGRGSAGTYDKAVVNALSMTHAVEWTKKAEWNTDSGRKAVLSSFRRALAKGMATFRRDVESYCMGAGDGVLATITSVSNAASKDTYVCTTDGFGIKLLRKRNPYSVYNSGLTTRRTFSGADSSVKSGEGLIEFYDLGNNTVRFADQVSGAVAGDKIVHSGLTATPPVWMNGVAYHHSDASSGTWQGLNRANIPEIRANRVTAAGNLQLAHARLAINKIGDRVGYDNQKKCVAWMHHCQKQAYEALGQQVSIINKNPKDDALNLYFSDNMQLAGAPIKCSYSWDKTRIDFIVKEVWGCAELTPAAFYEVDGRKIHALYGTSGGLAAAQIFYLKAVFNLFVNNPAVCSYISGLTIPTGYQ